LPGRPRTRVLELEDLHAVLFSDLGRHDKLLESGIDEDLLVAPFYVEHVDGDPYPAPVSLQIGHDPLVRLVGSNDQRMNGVIGHFFLLLPDASRLT